MSEFRLDPELQAIIVCPACHGDLEQVDTGRGERAKGEGASELVCQSCGRAYPVRDGIPVLLVDEARRPD